MATTTGLLLFDGAEELDFVGPWEVFTMSRELGADDRVVTIAERSDPVRCAKGMRVLPDHDFGSGPELDVVLVPGGVGTRTEAENPVLLEWLRKTAERCTWVTSVCTGSLLLSAAGLVPGRRVTTHWAFVEALRKRSDAQVLDDVRYVRDGNVVTAAGVSAGIDMALWLTGQIHGVEHARAVQRAMQYEPEPPYAP